MSYFDEIDLALDNLISGAFFTTKSGEKVNTMTVSWGFIGFAFRKPFFIAMVRPSRYSFEILQNADSFTISIPFEGNMKKALQVCGTLSGRDSDKELEAKINFVDSRSVTSPIIDDCDRYFECSISHMVKTDDLDFNEKLKESFYKSEDYHYLVFGEIKESY